MTIGESIKAVMGEAGQPTAPATRAPAGQVPRGGWTLLKLLTSGHRRRPRWWAALMTTGHAKGAKKRSLGKLRTCSPFAMGIGEVSDPAR
jgi:hypothetical protein